MGRIRLLDDTLVDQIAAGEVVERPASVVKELVENALDADAQTITVELVEGGRERIRIVDDGMGMDAEDAALAVRRHATSKLARFEDFRSLRTMGFRGEALASIASVSRFRLTTRPRDAVVGTEVIVEGGEPIVRPVGCPPGTTIDVRELFFNVPARKKFLRARVTEASHVADVCLEVALARPYLRLSLVSNGRRVREYLPTLGRVPRAQSVFSDQTLTPIEGRDQGITIEAALGDASRATTGLRQLHFFVNGRPVEDRGLAHAVAFAFGDRLDKGKYPSGVLHVELDPADVDVNAHPQKTEVRFADPQRVKDVITRVLTAALGTAQWSGGLSGTPTLAEVAPVVSAASASPSAGAHPSTESRGVTRDASYWRERLGVGPAPRAGARDDRWGLTSALRDGELFAHTELPEAPAKPRPPPFVESVSDAISDHSVSDAVSDAVSDSVSDVSDAVSDSVSDSVSDAVSDAVSDSVSDSVSVSDSDSDSVSVTDTDSVAIFDSTSITRPVLTLPSHWILDAPPRLVDRTRLAHAIFDALALPLPWRRLVFPTRLAIEARLVPLVDRARDAWLALGIEAAWVGERDLAVHTVPRLPHGLASDVAPVELVRALIDALRDGRDARATLRDASKLRAEPAALAALDLHPHTQVLLDATTLARLFADPLGRRGQPPTDRR